MIGRLVFDYDLETFLARNSGDKIAMLLMNGNSYSLINEVGNYIIKEEGDVVSYLPKSKINPDKDPWVSSGRVKIRIGRFANKFLKKNAFQEFNIVPTDIEQFVNLYKSYFVRDKVNFQVVSGEDIYKWYCYTSYHHVNGNTFGTLWNSCMRQTERNKFMKLYADNDSIKMLIMLADDGKLLGRALLWEDVNEYNTENKYKIMDRIYTIHDHDVNLFKNWAKENGYLHKMDQTARSEMYFVEYINGNPNAMAKYLYVTLPNHRIKYYPYLDTFKFYNSHNGTFSNNDTYLYEFILVQSNGGLVPPEPEPDPDEFMDEEDNHHDWIEI